MKRNSHSFLDLTALPQVGALLLDPRAAWLWSEDGGRILWSNAAGVRFFNDRTVQDTLQRRFPAGNPLAAQIASLSPAIRAGEPQMTLLRFAGATAPEALLCLATRVPVDEDIDGILVASMQPPATLEPLIGRAFGLAAAVAEDGVLAVVTRLDGRLVASSSGLESLDGGAAALAELAATTATSGRHMLKRRVRFGNRRRLVGMTAVTTPEGGFMLALVGPPEEASPSVPAASEGEPALEERRPPATINALAPANEDRPTGGTAEARPTPTAVNPTDPSSVAAPEAVEAEAPVEAAAPVEANAPSPDEIVDASPDNAASDVVAEADTPAIAEPAPSKDMPTATEDDAPSVVPVEPGDDERPRPFVFAAGPGPVRFAFQLDGDHRFATISPELATVVGPNSADVVGRPWTEVAARLGFTTADAVERALARRDTWSGVSVYWPIQDSADAVAVDLAALPAFSRAGVFEGFRGFGVCRTQDIKRGITLVADPVLDNPPPKEQSGRTGTLDETGSLAPVLETDAPRGDEGPELSADADMERSNVVRLPSSAPRDRNLSGNEQDAFRRIAEALATLTPRRAGSTTSPTPSQPPATAELRDEVAEPAAVEAPAAVFPMALLDRVPIGLLIFRDSTVLFANRILLHRLGYADLEALTAIGGIDALFAASSETEPDADPTDRRIQLRGGDGERVAIAARLHVVPWDGGTATMLSTGSDIDDRLSREELADERAAIARIDELEAVLDTATDGVLVLDADARIMSLNRSAEALFGVEATDVLGRQFTELLAEESRRSALDYLDGLARNGVASVLNDGREVIGRVPSGGLIPLFMTMGRLAQGGTFCAVLRDITQWKNAEEELIAARRTAEIANQQKSDFLAKISHEIRTPLNAVIGFSEVMLEERFGPIGSERYREYLKDIMMSGTHLMSLVNDLLDLSKIEAGKLDLAFAAVPVNEIIQECVALMQPEANRRRIIIRTSLGGSVPKVVADPRSLRQIVLNLLSNAVKFTLAGGQVIVSTALDDNGEVAIRIRDTGVGMSPQDLETALKPFRQIATSNRSHREGTGLGLPLTKALVEANRATFAIDSSPNQGTMARITFPTARVLPT